MDPALITGGTAVLTGGVGYLTARLQHKGERQRLDLEKTRVENEIDTHFEDRDMEATESRRELYLTYVDSFDAAWHLCHDSGAMKVSLLDKWWSDYQAIQQRMALLAARPVAEGLNSMRPLVSNFASDLEVAINENPIDATTQAQARRDVWNKHVEAIQGTQRIMEAHMRVDLGTPEY